MSMFSRFFGKRTASENNAAVAGTTSTGGVSRTNSAVESAPNTEASTEDTPSSDQQAEVVIVPPPPEAELNFDINVQIGGGKGWPTDVTVVYYHRLQGLICLGTEGGAVYACGEGFQYLRPWLTSDENTVISISAPTASTILVAFADNSLAVLDLPNLNVVDLLPGSCWLNRQSCGDITFIHVDEPAEKPFAFVGTSRGFVFVLEIKENIRVCEYMLTPTDLGLGNAHSLVISEVAVCPKDEKYIAVGFSSENRSIGRVVVFNIVKHKIKTTHDTLPISSLCWDHTGETLYAGSRGGKLYAINHEKHSICELWNSSEEADGHSDVRPSIRRVVWYPLQQPTDEPCLFVLLGNDGESGLSLKSVIVGLAPVGDHGEMQQVFNMVPILGEEVIGFRVVPTLLLGDGEEPHSSSCASATNAKKPVPALLILTQTVDEDDDEDEAEDRKPVKHLKLMRCPTGEVCGWPLETPDLPPPRTATEVQLGEAPVSSIAAMLPPTVTSSLSSLLVRTANAASFSADILLTNHKEEEDDVNSGSNPSSPVAKMPYHADKHRRFSARDFLNSCNDAIDFAADAAKYGIVLAAASADDFDAAKMERQDVVLLGHHDGLIIAWGVFLPQLGKEKGVGNRYIPLRSLRLGSCEVSCIHTDNTNGLLAAGDASGEVCIWEVFAEGNSNINVADSSEATSTAASSDGACSRLRRLKTAAQFKAAANLAAQVSGDEEVDIEEEIESSFLPTNIREGFRVNVGRKVTALLLVSDATTLAIGTEGGQLFLNTTFSNSEALAVDLSKLGDKSPVAGLHYAPFYHNSISKPCIYVILTSGVVGIVCLHTRSLIAYNAGPASVMIQSAANAAAAGAGAGHGRDDDDDEGGNHKHNGVDAFSLRVAICCVTNEYFIQVPRSDPNQLHPNSQQDAVAPSAAPKRDSALSRVFTRSSSNPVQAPPPLTIAIPDNAAHSNPRYFLLIMGGYLITYDLAKFSIVPPKSSFFCSMQSDTVLVTPISSHTIVSGAVVSYVEDASRAWMDPVPCFMCVDRNGSITVMSIRKRKAITHANLLSGVTTQPAQLQSGVMLGSGSCYMLQCERMLFSSTICSDTHILPKVFPLPTRVRPEHFAPERTAILKTGREQAVAVNKQAVTKRRQSMIALTSGPTDLDKVFSKTRSEALKDSLFAGAYASSSTHSPPPQSKAASMQRGVAATKEEMNELGEALAERGEKLKLLAMKMDAFKEQAGEYRELALEHNKKLMARSQAWGLGFF